MKNDSKLPASAPPSGKPLWRRVLGWPGTRLGWWSVGLAVAFELLMILNGTIFMRLPEEVPWRMTVLPFYGIFMMLCGLAAGIAGVVAVTRRGERSILVWLAILIGLSTLFFVLGEFLVPH